MNRKLFLYRLLAALIITGCKKARPPEEPKPAATPTPAPVAAAPVATPPPAHVANKNAVVIALCYHNIEDKKSNALTISVEEFEKEMQAIKDNGFTVIGMQDFLAWRRGEKEIPPKSALITLDDGWVSAYDNAWPVLKKFNYPFTLFIYINYVGTGGKSLSWDQIKEMNDAGVDIQSHTYSHSDLKKPGILVDKKTADLVAKDIAALGMDGWLRKEIIESKHVLEQRLGIKVNAIAYPFGLYNSKVLEIVKEAGYEAGFTVYGQQLRTSSPYDLLGRYAVEAKKPQIFADAMKMIGGGVSGTPPPEADMSQLASTSMITEPMSGETIGNPKPLIKANLATMGVIDAGSVKMRISGLGPVPAKYDDATKTISYQATKLTDKNYTVIITATSQGKKVETQWSFSYDATGKNVGPAPTAPLPPR